MAKDFRFIKFICIGVTNVSLDIITLSILIMIFGNNPLYLLILNPISYTISVISSFYLNGKFTFKDNDLSFKKFIKLYIAASIGMLLNTGIVFILINTLQVYFVFSKIIAALIVVFYNYNMCKKYVFGGNK